MSNGSFAANGSYPTLTHTPLAVNSGRKIRAITRSDELELVILFNSAAVSLIWKGVITVQPRWLWKRQKGQYADYRYYQS